MMYGIDPAISTLKMFQPTKKKPVADTADAPYKKYPYSMFLTHEMITPAQRDALLADAEFIRLRDIWTDAKKAVAAKRAQPKTPEPESPETALKIELENITVKIRDKGAYYC